MSVALIQVPYVVGDERHGASKGPRRLIDAGAADIFLRQGSPPTVEQIERGEPFGDTASASLAVCGHLAHTVRSAVASGRLPIILAGSCDASKGVLSGFHHDRCGIVWIDAHADFNTPETTITGFFPGMSLAILMGHCYRNLWARIGNSAPVAENATLLLGVRDVDAAEQLRLDNSAISIVPWYDGKPQGDVAASMQDLAQRVDEVYLHIDLDGLDPSISPGIVDEPVPGGLTLRDVERVIRLVTSSFLIRAVLIATYNPDRDQDETTLHTVLRILEVLAEYVTLHPPGRRQGARYDGVPGTA
jgi:arginase